MSFAVPGIAIADVPKFAWKLYDIETDSRAPPTQNVYHTVIDEIIGCKFWLICVEQNNDEVAAKNIDIRVTIDGEVTELIGTAMASSDLYHMHLAESDLVPPVSTLIFSDAPPLDPFGFRTYQNAGEEQIVEALEMHAFKLEVRQTSAIGTNQTLVTKWRKSLLEAV